MPYTHTIVQSWSSVGSPSITATTTKTGELQTQLDYVVPGGSSDLSIPITLDVSAMVSAFIYATRPVTLEVNSTSAPSATISVGPTQPAVWVAGGGTNPFGSTDVTAIFATLAAGADATLSVAVLLDV